MFEEVLDVPAGLSVPEVEKLIRSDAQTEKYLTGAEILKVIVVPGRIVNIVLKK